jgi:tellurite resistance protein
VSRINNSAFKNGMCAGCALVAAASGDVGPEEKKKFGRFMDTHPDLKAFDGAEMNNLFNSFCDLAEVSPIRLWKEIDKVPQAQRQDVMEMVARMAMADGNVDASEEKIIVKLCERWGFDKSDYVE